MRNSFSNLPSGKQMNQCVPLAHYLAYFAKQRTSGCGSGTNAVSGSVPSRSFFLRGDRTLTGQKASRMTQQGWGWRGARVYGDSDSSARWTKPPSPVFSCLFAPSRRKRLLSPPPARCELSLSTYK